MRVAAMSLTAAASGFVVLLFALPVVLSHNGVTYSPRQICALKGSTVKIGCSYKYTRPSHYTANKKVWFTTRSYYDDLTKDPAYTGRVTYSSLPDDCSLTITDLRESDSAEYKFRFETNQQGGSYTRSAGVTLTVTAVQVKPYSTRPTLNCHSSCQPHNHLSYTWYKNGQIVPQEKNKYLRPLLNPSDSYSCAVNGYEDLPSPSVCVQGESCNRVNYSNRRICAFKGSSVEISCTYKSNDHQIISKSWFHSGRTSEDLREDSEYAGRVEVIETERGRSTLRISDLRERDSAKYLFTFRTRSFEWGRSLPGTTLTVTDIQVQVKKVKTRNQLDCVTKCDPHASSYVWYKNGEQVHEGRSLSDVMTYDYENSYACALKGFEDFHSPLVCVNDQRCNRVIYTKQSICAFKGSSVEISCIYSQYDSYYDSKIQSKFWFRADRRNQQKITSQPKNLKEDSQYAGRVEVIETEEGRSTLRISDLRERDSAEYLFTFRTQNFEWGSSLPGTTLTVTALQVKVTRTSVHPSQSETELMCLSSCSPDPHPSFVWFKNDQVTHQQNPYRGQFSPGDVISCALKGHEGYRSAAVYAPKLPSVSVSPSAEIVEGSSVNLTCSSDANPAADYTWYKKNNRTRLSEEQQLSFSSIQSSDSGEYYCTAENELGRRTSESISIDVKYAPKLPSVSVSPSAEIVEDSSVNLTCSSDANPAADYTWYKENRTLYNGPERTHQIASVSSEDSGNYFCTAENQFGQAKSPPFHVDVEYAPKLPSVSVSPSAEIVEDSSVTLTCSSDANPAANYTWYKKNDDSAKAFGQNFTITNFSHKNSGNYYCEAHNRRGHQKSILHPINMKGSKKLAVVASVTVFLLAVITLAVFTFIRRKRCFKQSSSSDRPGNNAQQNVGPEHGNTSAAAQGTPAEDEDEDEYEDEYEDDLDYAKVTFSKSQEDPLYSNIMPTKPNRQNEEEQQEEDVEYSLVRFTKRTQGLRPQEAAEDSSALYSTVSKKYRV